MGERGVHRFPNGKEKATILCSEIVRKGGGEKREENFPFQYKKTSRTSPSMTIIRGVVERKKGGKTPFSKIGGEKFVP